MQLLPDSLSLWGKAQQMGEEAQTRAAQLFCLAMGASLACPEELECAEGVTALCIILHRSHRIRQKTQEKDIPFQHGKGTPSSTSLRLPKAHGEAPYLP